MTSTQPYIYRRQSLVEPDWQRFPGWRDVTGRDWLSLTWQRRNSVRTVRQLQELCGDLLHNDFYADLQSDQELRATMPLLITPQMINTIAPTMVTQKPGGLTDDFYSDPVRKYMMPAFSDRRTDWPSHPKSASDSLHEREMWTTEGLTHRYPTKVLAELVSSCTQYCGHCTRMDLVGTTTASTAKIKFSLSPSRRFTRILDYLRDNKEIRDVVVSGGDVANVPWQQLESFLNALLEIESIRDIRLASKALIGLPQFWMKEDVKSG